MIYTLCHVLWWLCFYCYNLTETSLNYLFEKFNDFIWLLFFPSSLHTMSIEWIPSWNSLPQILGYHNILILFPSWLSFCHFFLCSFRLAKVWVLCNSYVLSQANVLMASINYADNPLAVLMLEDSFMNLDPYGPVLAPILQKILYLTHCLHNFSIYIPNFAIHFQ